MHFRFLFKPILFFVCISFPLATGFISAWATVNNVSTWYKTIQKPSFNPPSWVFGPVWFVLYILMGIGFYLILITPGKWQKATAIISFLGQIVLNFIWSILFFYYHQIGLALIDILLLIPAITVMIRLFKPINKTASRLQIPYLMWVIFATILNATIWWLN